MEEWKTILFGWEGQWDDRNIRNNFFVIIKQKKKKLLLSIQINRIIYIILSNYFFNQTVGFFFSSLNQQWLNGGF